MSMEIAAAERDGLNIAAERAVLKRRSVRGAGATLGAQGVRSVLQFAAQIALAHKLAPSEFGLVAMVAPVLGLTQIFNDLGLTQATVQRPTISHRELTALFWLNLLISLGLAGCLAAAAPLVAWFYGQPRLVPIVAASASLLLLSGAAAQQIALLNRRMQFTALAAIDVTCVCAAVAVGLAAAWNGYGVWSLVLMQAANSVTILVLAWALSDWVPGPPRRGENIAALVRFGGHLTGFNLLAYAESNLGPVLIGRMSGAFALGLYDRAYKLVIVPWWQISLPIARVAVSLLSRLAGAPGDYTKAWRLMFRALLLVAAPGLLWAALVADRLTPALLGPAWRAAAPMVTDLALATVLVPFGASAYWLFVSQGRVREQLRIGAVTGAALVASGVIGVHWGPLGVARCYALFAPFIQGLPLWGAARHGPVRGAQVWQACWPILPALAAAAGSVELVDAVLPWLPVGALLPLAYGACGAALMCFPAGIAIVRDAWALREMVTR
jgi:PST family polysaccharide transporter